MPLPERAKELLMSAIAVSPIMKRFALPGAVGLILAAVGVWQQITWLTIVGLILAIPILWCYFVIMVIYPLMFLFEKLFAKPREPYWKE